MKKRATFVEVDDTREKYRDRIILLLIALGANAVALIVLAFHFGGLL